MIYFTTLIFTLLSHIARATPACGDVASPHDTYDLYDNKQLVFTPYRAVFDPTYENGEGNTIGLACGSTLASKYPKFKDIPGFPFVGGAIGATHDSDGCGRCWVLTNQNTSMSIHFTGIDPSSGFGMGGIGFSGLGASVNAGSVEVDAIIVDPSVCGF